LLCRCPPCRWRFDVFAAEQDVSAYLPAVLALTRRIFPHQPLTVRLEDDPEFEDYRH
jgi:hypothetical protein